MKRRDFLVSAAMTAAAVATRPLGLRGAEHEPAKQEASKRKILIAGGNYGTAFIRYMAQLTGKARPKLLFLPTASADSDRSTLSWYRNCAPLNVEPSDQASFIASTSQQRSWDDVLLSVDGIVCSGGNTLNQQAIWKAQGIDVILRQAWDRGIVLGGASAGSLCWFEEGTTDSRPKALSVVQVLGFLKGSHSPHYDAENGPPPAVPAADRIRPDEAGLRLRQQRRHLLRGQHRQRVVCTRAGAKAYYVSVVEGKVVEKVLEPELIS